MRGGRGRNRGGGRGGRRGRGGRFNRNDNSFSNEADASEEGDPKQRFKDWKNQKRKLDGLDDSDDDVTGKGESSKEKTSEKVTEDTNKASSAVSAFNLLVFKSIHVLIL